MTNPISDSRNPRRFARAAGGVHETGAGLEHQTVQIALLRKQIFELERRVDAITAGERKARADLLGALGANRDSAREQARLHVDLAARERVVTRIIKQEADLQAEIIELKSTVRVLEADIAAERTRSSKLPGIETALSASHQTITQLTVAAAEHDERLRKLSGKVATRARILGFIAEQLRQDRRRQLGLRAALDATTLQREQDFATERQQAAKRERKAIEAVLAARRDAQRTELKLRAERWQAWTANAPSVQAGPRRRNRLAKFLERILCRLGSPGVALAIARSGLWRKSFQIDARPTARRRTLLAYARSGASSDVAMKALFDQRFYLEMNPSVGGSRRAPLAHYLLHGDREGRSPHPLIDVAGYRAANPHELGSTGLTVLQHFLFFGAAKGLNPHPLFDVRYYVSQLSDPQDLAINPLIHYLRTGWRRGFNPHPLFDNDFYLSRHPDVAEMMMPPLLHYITIGAKEGRDPHPLFFSQWYQAAYADVQTSGHNPLAHFLERGLSERRNPSPFFDTDHYLRRAADAHSVGLDPLQHYLQAGAFQGLSPHRDFDCKDFLVRNPASLNARVTPFEAWIEAGRPAAKSRNAPASADADPTPHRQLMNLIFDSDFYAEQAGHLLAPTDDPLDHYLAAGWRLGLNPSRLFDTAWYLARYPDAMDGELAPLLHFVINGHHGLHDPHPLFDSRWYAERYPDVADTGEIPLVHYLNFGAREGRSPGPLFDAAAYERSYPDVVTGAQGALMHFLTRWPLDNRAMSFDSIAAESPHGADVAEWVAGIANGLVRSVRT